MAFRNFFKYAGFSALVVPAMALLYPAVGGQPVCLTNNKISGNRIGTVLLYTGAMPIRFDLRFLCIEKFPFGDTSMEQLDR